MRASWWLSQVVLLLSCLFLLNPSPLFAQVDRGGIVGLVTDPAGARVAGARVTVSNLATNQSIAVARTNKVTMPRTLAHRNIFVTVESLAPKSRAIQCGGWSKPDSSSRYRFERRFRDRICASDRCPPLLQTEASSLGTIETERRISELPLNGRNFIQLAYLGPEQMADRQVRTSAVECLKTSAPTKPCR